MARVRIEPAGLEFDVRPGESIAEAAWRLGYGWPTKCYGQAECMACFVRVVDGEHSAEPPSEEELLAMRTQMPRPLRGPLTRLGCRLKVTGEGLIVEKKGVRSPVPEKGIPTPTRGQDEC
jgi:2Fe-2S ferredoxin